MRQSPLLIGRSLRLLPGGSMQPIRQLTTVIIAVGLFVALVIVTVLTYFRRADRRFERRFRMPHADLSDLERKEPPEEGPPPGTDGLTPPNAQEPRHGDDQPRGG